MSSDEIKTEDVYISKRRSEIELELAQLLEAANSEFTVGDIKQAIFEEEEQDDFQQLIMMLDTGVGTVELPDFLEVVTDAWNYFPHRVLGGKAPAEVIDKGISEE